jgi:hypothetical protein
VADPTGTLLNAGDVVNVAGASSLGLYPSLAIDLVGAGLTGGGVAFEAIAQDGVTAVAVPMTPLGGGTSQPSVTFGAGNVAQIWRGEAAGASGFRVRCTGNLGAPLSVWVAPSPTPLGGAAGGGGGGTSSVQGLAAEGAAASGNPVRVGGWDGTNVRTLATTTAGNPRIALATAGSVANDTINTLCLIPDSAGTGRPLMVAQTVFDGANWPRQRTPNVFRTVAATAAGNTALWTPAAGKKFRLMRFKVQVTANAVQAAGGVLALGLQDATTDLNLTHSVFVPAAAGTTMAGFFDSGWIDLGNGVLSGAANQILNINLSAALTGGTARFIAAGVEE